MRSPMFTAITLLTLAIGIGANTAIFSVINGVLLKPLPYPDPERLVAIWHTAPGIGFKELNASPSTYYTYKEEGRTFQAVGLWNGGASNITGIAEPERVDTLTATFDVLPILGVQPFSGRLFTPKDDSPGSPETVILTHGYWMRKFGGDSSAVGRTMRIDGQLHEIIGVLPESFKFLNSNPALIRPMRLDRSKLHFANFSYQLLARLKPGATVTQANADVARMLPMLVQKFPPPPGMNAKMLDDAKLGPNVRPLMNDVIGDIAKVLWVLMATVGIVLFIACANVANLLLVRVEGRQQELAVRAALGAGWRRIARELLTESIALSLAGGALGVAAAYGAIRFLIYLKPANLPRLAEITIDANVAVFALCVSLVAGILFGLIPIFKYGGPNLGIALRSGGRTSSEGRERHRTRNTLVVVQVALALVLLIGSGLMIRTLRGMRQIQPGFSNPEQILTLRLSIPNAEVKDPEGVVRMHYAILQKLEALPGVQSVGLTSSVTMDGGNSNDPIFAEDRVYSESQLPPVRRYKSISPNFFKTMGRPLMAGRDLTWTDILEKRSYVLVSESMAREFWGSPAAAVGKRIRENPKGAWKEVVGVARDERDDGVDKKAPTIVYWPIVVKDFWNESISVRRSLIYAIRSPRAGTSGFLKEAEQAIWSINPNLPLANVRTVQEIYDRSMARTSFTLVMLAISSGMALLLGVIGIYGVISYSVSQRTREIGIRMALGAPHGKVMEMFVRHGMLLSGIGVICGLAIAIPSSRLMSALLFEVSPVDPVTYGAVALLLAASALLATYLPARRAVRVEPVEALRTE